MSHEAPSDPHASSFFTVLVIVIIIIIVTLLILPVVNINAGHSHRQGQCGKNQSQLMGSLVAYQTSEEVSYPKLVNQDIAAVMTAHQARQVTYEMFGILAQAHSLPLRRLSCPQSSRRRYKLDKISGSHPPIEWGMKDGPAVYAFDWSASADPSAGRVIIADRDPQAHKGAIMACFGDAHVKKINIVNEPVRTEASLITEGSDGNPTSEGAFTEKGDDIYTADGDKGEPLSLGSGDAIRTWVK